jgi:hypothetical protein
MGNYRRQIGLLPPFLRRLSMERHEILEVLKKLKVKQASIAIREFAAIIAQMIRKSWILGNPKIGGVFAEKSNCPKTKKAGP